MNPQGADLLSALRDIHAAPAAPWWPPSPGWWVLAALLAFVLLMLLRRGVRAYRRHLERRRLAAFVDSIEAGIDPASRPQDFLSAINCVFKLVALRAFPQGRCAHLQGEEWTAFLRRKAAAYPDAGALEVLARGPYQPAPEFDHAALARLARSWIRQYG